MEIFNYSCKICNSVVCDVEKFNEQKKRQNKRKQNHVSRTDITSSIFFLPYVDNMVLTLKYIRIF